jgi:hypothetical protein
MDYPALQQLVQSFAEIAVSMDWSAWVTAGATVVLAGLTFVYVRLTREILAAQSDPCVVLTVVHDQERPTILQLVARNVGTGLAHDIRFDFSRPLPASAFGLTEDDLQEVSEMTNGPLIDGIPALGPDESRKIDWGQYGGLKVALGDAPIVATCKFKKNGKEMRPTLCTLDVASFAGTVAVESPSAKSAKELEKISKSIQHLASGFHKLKVEIVSLPPDEPDQTEEKKKRRKGVKSFVYKSRS